MAFNICPAAVVAAPVECVWDLLADPALYDEWWEVHTERIVPEGKAAPGQVVHASGSAFGRKLELTLRIEMVNPEKHQIGFHVNLPFGMVNDQVTTCTAIDASSSRIQFG